MKKMLATIGALGLVATTGNTVVSCSWFNKDNRNDNAFLQLNTYEIHLAKRTKDKFDSEVIEILNYDQKVEEFQNISRDFLESKGIEIPLENKIKVDVNLTQVSGIRNVYVKEDKKNPAFILAKSKETRGKSTWSLILDGSVVDKEGETHQIHFIGDNHVYFDVIVD